MKPKLTIEKLIDEAQKFCVEQSTIPYEELKSDGKSIGTTIEKKFKNHLSALYEVEIGSSASGIDLSSADILTDIKVTSIKQPQSSCPYKDARQKIYGLGYNLLIFVYDKTDNPKTKTAKLNFVSCSFVDKERTADYTTTRVLREMVRIGANEEDIRGYLSDSFITGRESTMKRLATRILKHPPEQGYITLSNRLQWRLQHQNIVEMDEPIVSIPY